MTSVRVLVPVGLGLAAGLLNFLVLRGSVAPVQLTVAKDHIPPGELLTEEKFVKIEVRADRAILKSAVPFADCVTLYGKRARRGIAAGEVVFFEDARGDGEKLADRLGDGQAPLLVPVRRGALDPSLRVGDTLALSAGTAAPLGHYKVVGLPRRADAPHQPPRPNDDNEILWVPLAVTPGTFRLTPSKPPPPAHEPEVDAARVGAQP